MTPAPRLLRRLVASLALAATVLPFAGPTGAGAQEAEARPADGSVPIVRIEGRGHGHGVGLSQWGAHALARQGSSASAILSTFYPGTTLGSAGGEVTVGIDSRAVARVSFPNGGQIRAARGGGSGSADFPVTVAPGGTVTVRHTGAGFTVTGGTAALGGAATPYQDGDTSTTTSTTEPCGLLRPCATTTTTSSTTTTPSDASTSSTTTSRPAESTTTAAPEPSTPTSASPLWAVPTDGGTVVAADRGRSYRGVFQLGGGGGRVRITNHLDVEDYLRGMIEVPGHWPPAAVQAQVIAARTYALRAMAIGGSICDTDACQVYLGTARESAGLDAAVAATSGTVVRYGSGLAATYYSASAGGVSATIPEGFGIDGELPYLQPVEHPDDKPQPWTVDVALDDVARRFGYPGELTGVEVTEVGPSGRALAITMTGDAGPRPIEPDRFRRQLGLRSTLYTLSDGRADERPAAPRPADELDSVVGASGQGMTGVVQAPVSGDALLVSVDLATAPVEDDDAVRNRTAIAAVLALAAAAAATLQVYRSRRRGATGPMWPTPTVRGRMARWPRRRRRVSPEL